MLTRINQLLHPQVRETLPRHDPTLSHGQSELPDRADGWECLFVWGTWFLMTLVGVVFILRFASPIPFVDDWAVVIRLAGGASPSFDWLWSQHNEHRYPFSRLLMWATWRLTGGDLRAAMLGSFLPVSVAALALTVAVRRARGWMEYTDAFFPLVLLHLGNAVNFLWFIQSFFIWPACLYGLILCVLLNPRWLRNNWTIAGMGICLLCLPLHGAIGVAYIPALVAAFAAAAVMRWRDRQTPGGRHALLLLAFAASAVLLAAAYFWDFHRVAHHALPDRSPRRILVSAAQFLGMGVGPLAGRLGLSLALFVGTMLAAALVLLASAYVTRREERGRILLLLLALEAPLALALGISWNREETQAPRYIILAAPFWCWLYAAWAVYGRHRIGPFARMCLFAGVCALSLYHVSYGLELAKARQKLTQEFQKDVADGVPIQGLRQWAYYWCWSETPFAEGLELLRDRGIGCFAAIAPDPPMREIALPLNLASALNVRREGDVWVGVGDNSRLQFALDKPRFVYAVRLTYQLDAPTDPSRMTISWLRSQDTDPRTQIRSQEFHIKLKNGPPLKTQTVWVNDVIGDLAITPSSEPYQFRLTQVVLLVPEDS